MDDSYWHDLLTKKIVKRVQILRIIHNSGLFDVRFSSVRLNLKSPAKSFVTRITRFGKPEPKDKCIKWKIQTAINEQTCKRYAREVRKNRNS